MVCLQDSFLYTLAHDGLCFFSLFLISVKLRNSLLQEAMESLIKKVRYIQARKNSSRPKLQTAESWWDAQRKHLLCAHFFPMICPRFLCLTLLQKGCYSQLGDGYNTFSSSRERITARLSGQIHYLTQQAQALGNENQSESSEGLSYLIESPLRQRAGLSLGFQTSANVKLLLYLWTLLLVQTLTVSQTSIWKFIPSNVPLLCSAIRCYQQYLLNVWLAKS